MGIERRLHPRAIVGATAEIRPPGADRWVEVFLRDLSAGGAGIHNPARLPLQSEVRLRFRLPGGAGGEEIAVEVSCIVVRSTPSNDPGYPFLAGLHFLDLSGEVFERVRAWVWSRVDRG